MVIVEQLVETYVVPLLLLSVRCLLSTIKQGHVFGGLVPLSLLLLLLLIVIMEELGNTLP